MNTQFEYKGFKVEIVEDPLSIKVDGEDYSRFWEGTEKPQDWIKGMLDARLRSRLEFTIRDIARQTQEKNLPNVAQPQPSPRELVQGQMKRVVGPRVYSMITGETSPTENAQLNLLMANLQKLPPHIQHQLMKTRLPVGDLLKMLEEHLARNPSEDLRQLVAAMQNVQAPSAGSDQPSLTADRAYEAFLAKRIQGNAEAEEVESRIPSDLAAIFDADSHQMAATLKARKRENAISKAIPIVIANILAVPFYALFHKIGLDWASACLVILVAVFSAIILLSPVSYASWRAQLKNRK